MDEQSGTLRTKHLSAQELLRNKGICSTAWEEWKESSRTLPKIGENKQFEPNGSWLEKKQIEKGLHSREFLLGIERVERSSQLASAEWLPEQKRARVTKKIGNDWANFGQEINATLYLIPEEALLLLETECLELIWEGIPLSIQQAYELLIESEGSDCTLDEYRVYSQLTRLGYRLQRFHYEKSRQERNSGIAEPVHRKKVIVNPENGLWMAGINAESIKSSGSKRRVEIEENVKEIVESMVITINENTESCKISNDPETEEKPSERKAKNSRVEIISEQTILSPIKIVKDGLVTSELNVPKWPGARIQRNVKLLPKRNDKLSSNVTAVENSNTMAVPSKSEIERTLDKRKAAQTSSDLPESKKSKHEVIELSDDEAEEIPKPMSRMEMLNCLPNIANQIFITENISRRYVPRGVRAKSTYRYDSRKLKRLEERDRPLRENVKLRTNGSNRENVRNVSSNNCEAIVPYHQQQSRLSSPVRQGHPRLYNYSQNSIRTLQQNYQQFGGNLLFMNPLSSGFCMQQIAAMNRGDWQNSQNRWSSFYVNIIRNTAMLGPMMRNLFMPNSFQLNFHQNQFSHNNQSQNRPHRYLLDRSWRGSHSGQSRAPNAPRSSRSPSRGSPEERGGNVYQTSFVKLPGTSSWTDLKQKWRESKTITIVDEENGKYDEDINEIQIVDQTIKPLINPKNYRNFSEVYERLRIIKSAPDKTVRRKKSDLKISYRVYSSSQHYRKANPGLPIFRLVVTSRKGNVFLQPVELNRLQQDGRGAPIIFAHVSNSSIAYIQSGIITLPNLL